MVNGSIQKAEVLIEALPYIRTFFGKTFVIKYGGSAMTDPELKKAVMLDVILLKYVGLNPVIVHGGGPEISRTMERLGKEPVFVGGHRVTDAETMEIVQMVLVGKVNQEIVSLINKYGGKAVGLSGKDGNLIVARRRRGAVSQSPASEGEVDLGFVGDVESVNPEPIRLLSEKGYIPVIAPVGVGLEGESYNINADAVAGHLAAALKADKLIMLTDVEGIFADPEDRTTLISSLRTEQAHRMIQDGQIAGGMIPKVEACIRALEGGVARTHIIDGRKMHSLLLEIFTDQGIGTMVVP
ncbi:MAG: acetylglutamate kinase [Firmicutes bacterium]|nr:acetylglutamate kinase [Bacillota bacterium]MBO2520993.1 acetylglutamate kinase [Bacillota bacterium]